MSVKSFSPVHLMTVLTPNRQVIPGVNPDIQAREEVVRHIFSNIDNKDLHPILERAGVPEKWVQQLHPDLRDIFHFHQKRVGRVVESVDNNRVPLGGDLFQPQEQSLILEAVRTVFLNGISAELGESLAVPALDMAVAMTLLAGANYTAPAPVVVAQAPIWGHPVKVPGVWSHSDFRQILTRFENLEIVKIADSFGFKGNLPYNSSRDHVIDELTNSFFRNYSQNNLGEHLLAKLLSNLFGFDELLRFVSFETDFRNSVATRSSMSDLSLQVANLMAQRPEHYDSYFNALTRDRPGRALDIRFVKSLFIRN